MKWMGWGWPDLQAAPAATVARIVELIQQQAAQRGGGEPTIEM